MRDLFGMRRMFGSAGQPLQKVRVFAGHVPVHRGHIRMIPSASTHEPADVFVHFETCLASVERETLRFEKWRLCALAQALEAMNKNPGEALRHLDDFDRIPTPGEIAETFARIAKKPSLGNMRARFNRLKCQDGYRSPLLGAAAEVAMATVPYVEIGIDRTEGIAEAPHTGTDIASTTVSPPEFGEDGAMQAARNCAVGDPILLAIVPELAEFDRSQYSGGLDDDVPALGKIGQIPRLVAEIERRVIEASFS